MNDEFEQRFTYPIDGQPIPMVMITEDRYVWLMRIAGRAKKIAVEHKLEEFIQENVQEEDGTYVHTVLLRYNPIQLVGKRYCSSEMRAVLLPDPDRLLAEQIRRDVKRLIYNTVMQDVVEHPEDYRF